MRMVASTDTQSTRTVCDTKSDPNVATSCARQAVSNGDVGWVSTLEVNAPSIIPILQTKGIPYINPSLYTPIEMTSPVSYPLDGGVTVELTG